ncbi:hypothetical protein LIA77_06982 [Sarocladium implicatum]|nr:hypothetical protein LIA77_06982 [Sarocladium implicatum]
MRPSFKQIASHLPLTATPKLTRSSQPILNFTPHRPASHRGMSKSSSLPLSNAAASPSPDTQLWAIDDAECVYGYVSGGYHPVAIGDTLSSRCHVQYKLGRY